MTGETDLSALIASMDPVLADEVHVFATLPLDAPAPADLTPIMSLREREGVTLIVTRAEAEAAGLEAVFPCRMITLNIHSSLEAVGFLAALLPALAAEGMGVNPVSGLLPRPPARAGRPGRRRPPRAPRAGQPRRPFLKTNLFNPFPPRTTSARLLQNGERNMLSRRHLLVAGAAVAASQVEPRARLLPPPALDLRHRQGRPPQPGRPALSLRRREPVVRGLAGLARRVGRPRAAGS